MKKLFLALILALICQSSIAQSKIGTIDADHILAQMPEMAQVNENLETYGKELQTNLENTVKNYEDLVQNYQTENKSFSEEEKQTKEREIISLENDIKGFRQKASVMMQMRRNELTEPLYNKINDAMLKIVEEEGFTQILHVGSNALAFSAESLDITNKVLQKMGIPIAQ